MDKNYIIEGITNTLKTKKKRYTKDSFYYEYNNFKKFSIKALNKTKEYLLKLKDINIDEDRFYITIHSQGCFFGDSNKFMLSLKKDRDNRFIIDFIKIDGSIFDE